MRVNEVSKFDTLLLFLFQPSYIGSQKKKKIKIHRNSSAYSIRNTVNGFIYFDQGIFGIHFLD